MTQRKTQLRNLTILVGSTMTVLAGAALAPALPDMSRAFREVPNFEFLVRLTLTIPALFIALSAPIAGILLDRWGRRPVLLTSLLLYGVAGTAGFVSDSLPEILIGRALLGVAVAGLMSGFTTLIADNFSGSRLNQFMGYQGAFMGLGGMVFVLAGGMLADVGWHYPFLIYLFAFVLLPGVLLAVEEPSVQSRNDGSGDGAQHEMESQGSPASRGSQNANRAFPWKTLGVIYGTAFSGMLIFYIVPVQLPFFLTTEVGASNSQVGLALSLQTPTSVFAALMYRRLRERFSFQGIFVIVFLAFAVNYIILSQATEYWMVVASLMIGGFGLGLLPPNLNTWIASTAPASVRGRAIGGLTTTLFLGQFVTPFVTQPLIGISGFPLAFGTFAGASIVLMLAFVGATLIFKPRR